MPYPIDREPDAEETSLLAVIVTALIAKKEK
jgi:hypothetical protein